MKSTIEEYVAMHFSHIPFSENASEAQRKITFALLEEFEHTCAKSGDENAAFETIISRYPKLSDMAELIGCTEEEAAEWRATEGVADIKEAKKKVFSHRKSAYIIAASFTLFLVNLLEGIFWDWRNLMSGVVWIAATFLGIRVYRKKREKSQAYKYNKEAYRFLCDLSDRYTKKTINSIFIFIFIVSLFDSTLLYFSFGNMKTAELVTMLVSNQAIFAVPFFVCIKNALCLDVIKSKLYLNGDVLCRKHLKLICLFSFAFLTAAFVCTIALSAILNYPLNIYVYAFVIYGFGIAIYNLTARRQITFRNIVYNKKRIAAITAIAVVFSGYSYMQRETWYTQPYINSVSRIETSDNKISYNENTGVYTITAENEDFRVLQITDVHLGGSLFSYTKDIKALKATYALIEHTRPDLVVVTGDLVFPVGLFSFSLNNSAPIYQFAAFMRNVGIPWVFTYGNHDTEYVATHSETEINNLFESLSYNTSGTLLYPYTQPDITGRCNQLLEIRNSDGSLKQAIFLIDSNDYTGEGLNVYDYIHDDQVNWYADEICRLTEQEGRNIPSMVFFHIPLQEYRTAYELYVQGSDEVKYFFGENNEQMINKVCCSDYPSELFDTMVELGSTKAVFCGHDHYNNISLEYKGIRLTYGMSIDYLAMPGIENDIEQRGATLITLHSDGSFDIEQIPLQSIVE